MIQEVKGGNFYFVRVFRIKNAARAFIFLFILLLLHEVFFPMFFFVNFTRYVLGLCLFARNQFSMLFVKDGKIGF